jgi:hypothetical protein
VRVAHLRDVDMVFTDAAPPPRLNRLMRENGVQLFVPDPDAAQLRTGLTATQPAAR